MHHGGVVASWLLRLTPDQVGWAQAKAGDIALCFCPSHSTLTVPLSVQVYKWVSVNLMLEVTLRWTTL